MTLIFPNIVWTSPLSEMLNRCERSRLGAALDYCWFDHPARSQDERSISSGSRTPSPFATTINTPSGSHPPAHEMYSRKVFVGGLPPDIDQDEIKEHFVRYGHLTVVSSPDPYSQQLRVDYITATWKVGLGNKNDALVPSVPKHWDGCVYT